jgi:hypothetical protein
MGFKNFILKYLFVIFMGFVVFYIDSLEFVDVIVTKFLILILVIFKSIFFFTESFKKILEATKNDIAYHNFLIFMAVDISLIVLSFGIDFLCLYQVQPLSFSGISPNLSFGKRIFEMIYFSLLNFSNFGFGEIIPVSMFGKIIVTIEIIISFITIIFILSDFVSLKESFSKHDYSFSFRRKKTTKKD